MQHRSKARNRIYFWIFYVYYILDGLCLKILSSIVAHLCNVVTKCCIYEKLLGCLEGVLFCQTGDSEF